MTMPNSNSEGIPQKRRGPGGRAIQELVKAKTGMLPLIGKKRGFRVNERTIRLPNPWSDLENEVHYLVYFDNHFIVYIDHELDIEWKTTDDLDKLFESKGDEIKSKHFNVLAQAAVAETMPTEG